VGLADRPPHITLAGTIGGRVPRDHEHGRRLQAAGPSKTTDVVTNGFACQSLSTAAVVASAGDLSCVWVQYFRASGHRCGGGTLGVPW
jgi:hypothetical protein